MANHPFAEGTKAGVPLEPGLKRVHSGVDHGKLLFRNALFNSGRRPVGAVITIFLTPFILSHLGQEVYGVWALTGSVLAYSGLLALGLNSAVTYQVPQLLAKNDHDGINRVLSSVFAFYCVGALLSLGFGLLLVWKFPDWFNVPVALQTPARIVVALLAANVALQIPLSVYRGVVGSLQRWDIIASINVASQILRALGIVVAFLVGFGLIALAAISVASYIGATLVLVIYAYKHYPELSIGRRRVDWSTLSGLIAYSLNTLMYTAGQVIVLQSGKTLIGLLYGPAAVTVFAIPFTLLIMVSQVVNQAVQPLKPAVSMLHGEGRRETIGRIYLLAAKYSLMIALPVAVLFVVSGEGILKAWIGDEFSAQSAVILTVMTIPQMLRVVNTSGFFVLSGLGVHRFFGWVTLIQSFVSVVLGYVLAEPAGLGLLGVALGISIPELFASGLIVPVHVARTMDVKLRKMKQNALRALTAAIPFALYCLAVRWFVTSETRVELIIVFALSALPLAVGVWFLGLTPEERERFKRYLKPFEAEN